MDSFKKLYLSTYFLCNFKALKEDVVFKNFVQLLYDIEFEEKIEKNIESFINFVSSLKKSGNDDFSSYLEKMITKNCKLFDDEEQVEKELKILTELSKIQYQNLKDILCGKYADCTDLFDNLPYFLNLGLDIKIADLKNNKFVYDEYKNNRAFIFDIDLEIKPVELSENINFSSLKGYVEQKRILKENTQALLSGKKVNNILLYGDAGCGKSSSVRALLNEFEDLKIVQIFKKNLINLDKLYLKLGDLPYKFIIFADDISFDETDNTFSTMKAIIEGSLIQCPENAVIYATSNRRHLVKESFKSRAGDEIHLNDTINEINSLSERFGINLFFSKPTNEEFNQIVLELAKDNNIDIDENTLIEKAQRLALIKGSRSPRIAKQLIDNLLAHINV